MKRYFLDTCVLLWLLEDNRRIRKISKSIADYEGNYAISMEVLKEYLYLLAFGHLQTKIGYDQLLRKLVSLDIEICSFEKKHLKYLAEMPTFTKHTDPADRNIIAHAIADKRTLISGDGNFHLYEKYGLKLLAV